MNMKNLLQALNDIEPPKVEDKKRLIQEGAGPGQILNVQMEELDAASLRYLSGVRKTLEGCGMAPMSVPMSPSVPKPPATLNITAADAHELGSLLKTMTGLNGNGDYKHEPVYRADPSPLHHSDDGEFDMRGMVKLIDDGEIEEEIIQDEYDNTPNEQYLDANWPLYGDIDNNQAANQDVIVDRNKMDIAEQLMADYRAFVAEESKPSKIKKEEIDTLEGRVSKLQERLTSMTNEKVSKYIFNKIVKKEKIEDTDFGEFDIDKDSIRPVIRNLRILYQKLVDLDPDKRRKPTKKVRADESIIKKKN